MITVLVNGSEKYDGDDMIPGLIYLNTVLSDHKPLYTMITDKKTNTVIWEMVDDTVIKMILKDHDAIGWNELIYLILPKDQLDNTELVNMHHQRSDRFFMSWVMGHGLSEPVGLMDFFGQNRTILPL